MSSDLLKHLSAASTSLAQFQQLAFPDFLPQSLAPSVVQLHALRPASFPSSTPSRPALYPNTPRDHHHTYDLPTREPPFVRQTMSRSPSLGSDCCGGIMDCTDLVEEERDELQEDDPVELSTVSLPPTSEMRSTSNEIKT